MNDLPLRYMREPEFKPVDVIPTKLDNVSGEFRPPCKVTLPWTVIGSPEEVDQGRMISKYCPQNLDAARLDTSPLHGKTV
jgi:hypothetical protein